MAEDCWKNLAFADGFHVDRDWLLVVGIYSADEYSCASGKKGGNRMKNESFYHHHNIHFSWGGIYGFVRWWMVVEHACIHLSIRYMYTKLFQITDHGTENSVKLLNKISCLQPHKIPTLSIVNIFWFF